MSGWTWNVVSRPSFLRRYGTHRSYVASWAAGSGLGRSRRGRYRRVHGRLPRRRLLAADAARTGALRRQVALARLPLHRGRVQDSLQDVARPGEVLRVDLAAELVRPCPLRGLDLCQRRRPGRRKLDQLRPLVARVAFVGDEPVALELVGDPLDALAREAPRARDLGDAQRRRFDRRKDAPARTRLPGGAGERIAHGLEGALQPEHQHDQPAERLARRGALLIDSILSF